MAIIADALRDSASSALCRETTAAKGERVSTRRRPFFVFPPVSDVLTQLKEDELPVESVAVPAGQLEHEALPALKLKVLNGHAASAMARATQNNLEGPPKEG